MSQSSRRHATAGARKLWRLAGDVACLLLHGSLHRPRAFASAPTVGHGRVAAALSMGILTRAEARKLLLSSAPHDYSAHVRGRFEYHRALIFLGEPFDGDDLHVRLDQLLGCRPNPRHVQVAIELRKHGHHALRQPEPSPQYRRKLVEARPALSDVSRVDRPAHWVADAFTTRAARSLGTGHPRVLRHAECVRESVLAPLRTGAGPVPLDKMPKRGGPHRDGPNTFDRRSYIPRTFDPEQVAFTFGGAPSGRFIDSPLGYIDSPGSLLGSATPTLDPEWYARFIEEVAMQAGIPARILFGYPPQQTRESARELLRHDSTPHSYLTAHPGVDSFELVTDYERHMLRVAYRGTISPEELEAQLGEVVSVAVAVQVSKMTANTADAPAICQK